jgi:serine/threonine-protein kinase
MLAGRYRIVAKLGRGGMGEVFRAEDLTLEQEVALKFLPPDLANDPAALARFHSEVRIARQVSHPNVCRVFDIGMAGDAPFITMEYVDGEDLASLIRRVGRFPQDKGVEIARQICAGLAAAHEQGLLHRDLKPANVMLDGRGRVRVADFGLASLAGEVHDAEIRAGTPAYMAPEQLAGAAVTVKSDIYALGLVLYEIFTGKRAYDASTLAELQRLREISGPPSPTTFVKDLDPIIERVIQRCLEKDPAKRPSSALQVAAALPGGDPLAAALAAGETPSPEMVAAAGSTEGVRPLYIWSCVAIVLIGLVVEFALTGTTRLYRTVGLPKSPDVLTERAQNLLHDFGYTQAPEDSATGFDVDAAYVGWVGKNDKSPSRWANMPSAIEFWYRQSPQDFDDRQILGSVTTGRVSSSDPPQEDPGMVMVYLNPQGRLTYLRAVTQREVKEPAPSNAEPDWNRLLMAAGFDPAQCKPAQQERNPPTYADAVAAWTAALPERPDVTVHIEAAAYHQQPVYFTEIAPWTPPPGKSLGSDTTERVSIAFVLVIVGSLLVFGSILAWQNVKRGRGDQRGALRLAAFTFALTMLTWVVGASHVAGFWEAYSLTLVLAWSSLSAVFLWMMYLALEPIVRRRMPALLISWNRLLAGQFNDPMIGRDLLAGTVVAVLSQLLSHASVFYNAARGLPPPEPSAAAFVVLTGGRVLIAQFLSLLNGAVFNGLALMFMFVIFQLVFRKWWLAGAAFIVFWTVRVALQGGQAVDVVANVVTLILLVVLVVRFGLLAVAVQTFVGSLLEAPFTTQGSAWYAWMGWVGVAVIALIVGFGVRTALAGQPLLGHLGLADD